MKGMLRAWLPGPTTKVDPERRACRISAASTRAIRADRLAFAGGANAIGGRKPVSDFNRTLRSGG